MSALDRGLRIVGDVRGGEGAQALVLAGTVFLILNAYYLLKVAREALLLSKFDAETKTYLSAGMAIILIPAVETYGWLSNRVGRVRLVTIATLFFATHLTIFAALYQAQISVGPVFFVWVGIFSVFVIAQFWAFANDVYIEADGRRLFSVIGVESSLGAILGSYAARPLGALIGTLGLLLVPAGLLVASLLGIYWVHAQSAQAASTQKTAQPVPIPSKDGRAALALLFSDRYLMLIAAMWILANWVNSTGEYILDTVMLQRFKESGAVGADLETLIRGFKSSFYFWVNTISFALQLFVVGRLMKRGGAGLAIVILPLVSLLGQAGAAFSGVALVATMIHKILENSVDYSIQNTGRNALFLVTSGEAKYKVKVLVDSVGQRAGDVLAAVTVGLAAGVLHLAPISFLALTGSVTLLWMGCSVGLAREYIRRARK